VCSAGSDVKCQGFGVSPPETKEGVTFRINSFTFFVCCQFQIV
jgi:hypothetical protein